MKKKKRSLYEQIEPVAKKLIKQQQLHLEQYAHLPRGCQYEIDAELQKAMDEGDILAQALIHSGIRGIEEMIKMYVTKYIRPQKITTVVSTFEHGLKSAEAFASTKKEITSRQDELKDIADRMEKLANKLASKKENEEFKKKLRKLNIMSKLAEEIQRLIQDVESELTDFFDGCPVEMDEDEAANHIRKFKKRANEKQEEFQDAVEKLLNKDIKEKSNSLLQEYIKKLEALKEEFSGDGLKIDPKEYVQGTLAQLKDEYILVDDSLDSRIESHTEKRTRDVKKKGRRRGWDRLFHISSWFDPTYTYITTEQYEVEVKEEVTFVSREKLINQLIAPIQTKMLEERVRILDYADTETESIMCYFANRFDEVDQILEDKARELAEAVSSEKAAQKALEEATALLDQLKVIESELNAILEI